MENFEEEGFVHSDGPGTPRNRVYQEPSAAQETQARSRRYCLYHLILYGGVVVFLAAVNLIFYEFHNAPLQNPYPVTTNSVKKTVMTSSLSVSPNVESQALSTKQAIGRRFPRVFWIYTENELETEAMSQLVYLYHFNETAWKMGYQVRIVNSWTAYNWLSKKTTARITRAVQSSKVDEPIHNLLKMALLMEKGGVVVNQFDIVFLGDSFRWIEDMFDGSSTDHKHSFSCEPKISFLYMLDTRDQIYGRRLGDPFIAAVPQSLILQEAFDMLLTFIVEDTVPFDKEFNLIKKNGDIGVNFLANSFEETINLVLFKFEQSNQTLKNSRCSHYGVQSRKQKNIIMMNELTQQQRVKTLTTSDPEVQLKQLSGLKEVHMVRGVNSAPTVGILNDILQNEMNHHKRQILKYQPGSIIFRIVNAPTNRQVFVETLPRREIELCLIVMTELDKKGILQMMEVPKRQTYQKWKQVMLVKENNFDQAPKITDKRFIVINSTGNPVRNIEVAALKHCGTNAYALLLNKGQQFESINALAEIAWSVTQREVVGTFISLKYKGNKIQAKQDLSHFHRGQEAIVNPNINKLERILNQFRVFSIESFKYIPQFDLRDIHGKYFEDRLIFLMTLLEMVRTEITQPKYLYILKRYSNKWNVPRRAVVKKDIILKVEALQEINREQLYRTKARLECEQIQESIHNIVKWKIPFSKMLAFNDGTEFEAVEEREKKEPHIIPKVIHQVWLGTSELPPAKKYFYHKTRLIYPNYEIKLWREQNVTKRAFPFTYSMIKNLLRFNKESPYNKLATVTDIMRHEILYWQGGFWKDAGMNMLRPIFDKFLTYSVVIAVDKTFRYRWLQGMCFFGNTPKLQNILRVTTYQNLNRMRIYTSYASAIAGPVDFRQYLVGQEEYSSNVLCMPYESFYPAQVTQHPLKDQCTKREEEMTATDSYEIEQNGWFLLSNCSKIYSLSYAVEHNRFGDSWSKRKEVL